jgi:hypothetical protein
MTGMPIRLLCIILLIAGMFSACATGEGRRPGPQPLSTLQRAAMQTKELQGDFDTAFAATISVMQDEGWQIDVVDKQSGIIQASSLKRQDIIGPAEDWYAEHDARYRDKLIKKAKKEKHGAGLVEWTRWERLTAHIEPWAKDTVRHRITITKFGSLPTTYGAADKKERGDIRTQGGKEQSVIIENPATYQYLFQQIQRAVFVRQGLTGKQ